LVVRVIRIIYSALAKSAARFGWQAQLVSGVTGLPAQTVRDYYADCQGFLYSLSGVLLQTARLPVQTVRGS
jgi:hypothetical protein